MSDQYCGEIRIFSGTYSPQNFAFCDGSILSVSDNQMLFAVIGITYGGNGYSTLALPNLTARIPVSQGKNPSGSNYSVGYYAGQEAVMLTTDTMPEHSHIVYATTDPAGSYTPEQMLFGGAGMRPYDVPSTFDSSKVLDMSPSMCNYSGNSALHNNVMPVISLYYIIAVQGIYPTRANT